MRLIDYSFVFDGWQPVGVTLLRTGYNLAVHLGLPFVQFHAITDAGCVSVRCDPCSLDQDRAAYAAMVRSDLEKAMARQQRTQTPESEAPTRLARHLRESEPGMTQDGGKLTLYFYDDAKVLEAFWLIHEVMGGANCPNNPPVKPRIPCSIPLIRWRDHAEP